MRVTGSKRFVVKLGPNQKLGCEVDWGDQTVPMVRKTNEGCPLKEYCIIMAVTVEDKRKDWTSSHFKSTITNLALERVVDCIEFSLPIIPDRPTLEEKKELFDSMREECRSLMSVTKYPSEAVIPDQYLGILRHTNKFLFGDSSVTPPVSGLLHDLPIAQQDIVPTDDNLKEYVAWREATNITLAQDIVFTHGVGHPVEKARTMVLQYQEMMKKVATHKIPISVNGETEWIVVSLTGHYEPKDWKQDEKDKTNTGLDQEDEDDEFGEEEEEEEDGRQKRGASDDAASDRQDKRARIGAVEGSTAEVATGSKHEYDVEKNNLGGGVMPIMINGNSICQESTWWSKYDTSNPCPINASEKGMPSALRKHLDKDMVLIGYSYHILNSKVAMNGSCAGYMLNGVFVIAGSLLEMKKQVIMGDGGRGYFMLRRWFCSVTIENLCWTRLGFLPGNPRTTWFNQGYCVDNSDTRERTYHIAKKRVNNNKEIELRGRIAIATYNDGPSSIYRAGNNWDLKGVANRSYILALSKLEHSAIMESDNLAQFRELQNGEHILVGKGDYYKGIDKELVILAAIFRNTKKSRIIDPLSVLFGGDGLDELPENALAFAECSRAFHGNRVHRRLLPVDGEESKRDNDQEYWKILTRYLPRYTQCKKGGKEGKLIKELVFREVNELKRPIYIKINRGAEVDGKYYKLLDDFAAYLIYKDLAVVEFLNSD